MTPRECSVLYTLLSHKYFPVMPLALGWYRSVGGRSRLQTWPVPSTEMTNKGGISVTHKLAIKDQYLARSLPVYLPVLAQESEGLGS